jgi:hypothetical protein
MSKEELDKLSIEELITILGDMFGALCCPLLGDPWQTSNNCDRKEDEVLGFGDTPKESLVDFCLKMNV